MIAAFLTAKTAAGRAGRTVEFYARELGAASAWMQARGADLADATAEQIEMHLADERRRGLSAASVSARYRAISAYLRWLPRVTVFPLLNVAWYFIMSPIV